MQIKIDQKKENILWKTITKKGLTKNATIEKL